MKLSKFLKDLFFTGFSQGVVLLLGVLFLKVMATVLDKTHFGLFYLVRRWVATLVPLVTLSLGLSLTKFVSFDRKNENHYFKLTLGIVNAIFVVLIAAAFLLDETFSRLLFTTPDYTLLTKVFTVFLYASALYLLIYSFLRGQQEMIKANLFNLAYFGFPLLLAVVLLVLHLEDKYRTLIIYYSLFAVPLIVVCFFYFRRKKVLTLIYPFKFKLKEIGSFLGYGLTRMPASFLLSLVLGFPVIWASHRMSFEVAGLIGIAVAVIRMMEIFASPFNRIFLPKFSEFKGMDKTEDIKGKSLIVVNFMITFLPVIVVLMYGLSKYIVVFLFGEKFIEAVPAVEISILLSAFYLMHELLRGILNGIFIFPYVNVICLIGAAAVLLPTVIFLHHNLMELTVSFGIGLFALGVSSIYILMKKLKLRFPFKTLLVYAVITAVVFVIVLFVDRYILKMTSFSIYVEFLLMAFYRFFIFLVVFFLSWRKTLWYIELRKRIKMRR
jgi:O-antigen/teichoic acid export membrane protein